MLLLFFVFVFLKLDITITVKNFWPHRSKAIGFSIQDLANKYRLTISRDSKPSINILNQIQDGTNLKSVKEEGKSISVADLNVKRIHWANRDFSEYKEAA